MLAFDQHHAVLVVSKPSPNQLFPGFGIVKVNVHTCQLLTWAKRDDTQQYTTHIIKAVL